MQYSMINKNIKLCWFCQDEWWKMQPEDYQKLVDGFQKHYIDVKMARRLSAKYYNYFMYIF